MAGVGLGLGTGCAVEAADTADVQQALHSCDDDGRDADATPVFLDQGWDETQRALFYQTTQGSRMLPYDWFLHLEQATSKKRFRAPANMRRMGFLVDGVSPANPDGLPVGFARDDDPVRGASLGLTCAACHTGQVEYNGTRVRIDGGQSLADLEQLQDGLLASLDATLADNGKFYRFAKDVLGPGANSADREALRAEVEEVRDWWAARVTRSRGLTPHGPSRSDAFTIISNEVVCHLFEIPENCAPAFAPTQFPFVWDTPDFEWVQYNSSVHSSLGRNVGEVTGVFAEASFAADGSIDSSADIDNLVLLEQTLAELRSPAWPEDILGDIDHGLAAQGELLYAAECADCHPIVAERTAPNSFGVTFAKVDFSTPVDVLGTDPTAALTFATRRVDPGPLTAIAASRGLVGPDGKAPVPALLNIAAAMIIDKFFVVNGFTDLEKLQYVGFRESRSTTVAQLTTYKARPLNGVALTAPFLHNGSVASMYELLLPPEERMTAFHVGSYEFDPVHLGYSTEPGPGTVLLDTAEVGNGNGGHYYGTSLSDPERMALIEYIKTL